MDKKQGVINVIRHEKNRIRVIGVFEGIQYKLFQIQFHKGRRGLQLFVHPFIDPPGLLSKMKYTAGGPDSQNVSMLDNGFITKHVAKYSHGETGYSHLSQDGRIYGNLVTNNSVPLKNTAGHLFTIHLSNTAMFPRLEITPNSEAHNLRLDFVNEKPTYYKLTGWWYDSATVKQNIQSGGPHINMQIGSELRTGVVMAPTFNDWSDQFFLALMYEGLNIPSDEDTSSFNLIGGFSATSQDFSKDVEFLSMVYPHEDGGDLPSADFRKLI